MTTPETETTPPAYAIRHEGQNRAVIIETATEMIVRRCSSEAEARRVLEQLLKTGSISR